MYENKVSFELSWNIAENKRNPVWVYIADRLNNRLEM